jgi:hypothetical protein
LATVLLLIGFSTTVELPECVGGNAAQDKSDPPKRAKVQGSLTLVNESGTETVLSPADFAKLPRKTVKAKDRSGVAATYEGVLLADVLHAGKVTLGKDLKGPLLAHCLLVEAADAYQAVFSLPEVDPSMTDHLVLVADRKDAKPLEAREAPYRLVVPQEKKHARWVRQVTRLSVRTTAEIGGPPKK